MWSAREVSGLRGRLGVTRRQLAKLVGVDVRTVIRWESDDGPRPKGASAAVLTAIRERLDGDPDGAERLSRFLAGAAAVGGLAYLLVKLLGSVTAKEEKS